MNTKYALAGFGLTLGLAVAAAAPALADPTSPEPISALVTKVTPHLTVGSTLTVASVDGGFNWRAGFPFALDDGTRIGECVADQATLTRTLTFTPPVGALVCVTFPDATKPVEGQTTYTNRATINGASLEATATIKASGGTDGDGTVKPTLTPAPTPTTEPTPAPAPTTEPTPAPAPTTASPKPEPKADAQPAPAPTTRLARTGATLDGIGVSLVALLIGAALVLGGHIISRRFTK